MKINKKELDRLTNKAVRCDSFFSRARGLMFRKNPKPLLFCFKKPARWGIHSFFVFTNFLCIWFNKGRIVDMKIVKPWTAYAAPNEPADQLLELPLKSAKEISQFLVGGEKTL